MKYSKKKNRTHPKAIAIPKIAEFVLLAVGLIILVFVVVTLFPGVSASVKNIGLEVKKPICCGILNCKPATQGGGSSFTQPGGAVVCSVLCFGVCG
jgi:hypothetical protein